MMKKNYATILSIVLVFIMSCEIPNNPVELVSLTSSESFVWSGDEVTIVCQAQDIDNDKLSYNWNSAGGELITKKDTAFWTAPDSIGYYHIICKISDGVGSSAAGKVTIRVVSGGFVVKGSITDAVTNSFIENVEVSMNGEKDFSQANGNYSFFLANGDGSYELTAENNSYCPFYGNFVIPEDYTLKEYVYNFSMSPIPEPGEIRFVLNWGAEPRDLDSHLKTPEIDSVEYHISYSNRGNAYDPPYAILDVDDTDGYGPETITIKQTFSGTYIYYIHNYSGGNFSGSNGTVRVYNSPSCDGEKIDIPEQGSGRYWYVCEIDGESGSLNIINQIVEIVPGD